MRFQLPWSHYVRLLAVENPKARAFYEAEALRSGWTVRQLTRQIDSQFYERTLLSKDKARMLRKGGLATTEEISSPEEEIIHSASIATMMLPLAVISWAETM